MNATPLPKQIRLAFSGIEWEMRVFPRRLVSRLGSATNGDVERGTTGSLNGPCFLAEAVSDPCRQGRYWC